MTKVSSRAVLLFVLGCVVGVKFLVLPILLWQEQILSASQAKYVQLQKVAGIVENEKNLISLEVRLLKELRRNRGFFYVDRKSTKLDIQRDIESIFAANDLDLSSFNWVLDSQGDVRRLRASVSFSGPQDQMIRTLWDISKFKHLLSQVQFRQQFTTFGDAMFGFTQGVITLEAYAVTSISTDGLEDSTASLVPTESRGYQ